MLSFYLTPQKQLPRSGCSCSTWVKRCVQVERKCVLELRVLRPGMWFDFVDSVQAWQGQPDVIQLALSKKKSEVLIFIFFSPMLHCRWGCYSRCWLQLAVLPGSDRRGQGFVPESTSVLPSGHAHVDECTRTSTCMHAC